MEEVQRIDQLETTRLLLRRWKESDVEPFAAMNANPEVMKYFVRTLTPDQTADMVANLDARFDSEGFGLWAVEVRDSGDFIGFTGLSRPKFEFFFTPCVEIGWRLNHTAQGKGYATEAAKEVLRDGFERLALEEIVSFAAAINERSINVMKKIGMKRNASEDFRHPMIDPASPLAPHVLYRLSRHDWRNLSGGV